MTYQVKIIGSGSDGNCVVINKHLMIDAGMTKKRVSEQIDLKDIKTVLITHEHGDHFHLPFVRWLIKQYVDVWLSKGAENKLKKENKIDLSQYPNVHRYTDEPWVVPWDEKLSVLTVKQKHYDIVNRAIVLEKDGQRLLYATDLDTLAPSHIGEGLLHLGTFDVIMLEGNYDEDWLRYTLENTLLVLDETINPETMTNKDLDAYVRKHYRDMPLDMPSTLFRVTQNRRHLSKQQARLYVSQHLKPNGTYYEIHRSSRFYERPSEWDAILNLDE